MAHPALPASPTLTNPDMILPYGEYDATSSPQDSYRPPSPGEDWNPASMQFSIGPPSQRLPLTPETPIIYGNGTMLSDIGEVTEAESTAGRKLPGPAERRMLKKQASAQAVARSSPTNHNTILKRAKTVSHIRHVSVESTSTITSEGQSAEIFQDFDDTVSVEDSVFQGDDEESVADSYSEGVIASETERLAKKGNMGGQDEDEHSSAALSRRAEQILLNAKMRLNNMEGNLTRARVLGSISIHSSSPLSRSTPSPLHHTQTPVDTPMTSPGHSRVYSENSIPKQSQSMRFPVRPSSAAARYRVRSMEDLNRNQSPEQSLSKSGSSTPKHSPPHKAPLEPLSENEVPDFKINRSSVTPSIDDGYTSGGSEIRGLTRPISQSQMRDLKDQMSDLKGRLSVLRDRARDDTMKRKSLQNLRTPSPFTAAEQWYTADTGYTAPGLSADAGVGLPSPSNDEKDKFEFESMPLSAVGAGTHEYAQSDSTSVYEDVSEEQPKVEETISQSKMVEDNFDTVTEDGQEQYFDDASDYTEEMVKREELDDYDSDSSLYHDTVAHPISHEDREDAFDYEHFFLHSAMGTIGQDRRGSFSSDDSVVTTVPDRKLEQRPSLTHLRSESATSVSTVDTFKTATEGESPDSDGERDPYAVRRVSTSRPTTPLTSKRSTFGSPAVNTERREESRPTSVIHNPVERTSNTSHRPSISSNDSYGSAGTTRSFPLINRPKSNLSLLQNGSSASPNDLAGGDRAQSSPVQMLSKDDQLLVESLVASLGKCVLGLQDASGGGYEGRVWRRRLDAARRTLEGEEGAI